MLFEQHVVVYGKEDCPKCNEVVTALENTKNPITFEYLKMGVDFTRDEIMEKKPPRVREFPVCFIGNDSNESYISNNDLMAKLLMT